MHPVYFNKVSLEQQEIIKQNMLKPIVLPPPHAKAETFTNAVLTA